MAVNVYITARTGSFIYVRESSYTLKSRKWLRIIGWTTGMPITVAKLFILERPIGTWIRGDILEEMQGLNTRLSLTACPLASSMVTSRLVSFVGASLIFARRRVNIQKVGTN